MENLTDNESESRRKSGIDGNIQGQRRYDEEETASIKSETKKFNGIRTEEADKKLQLILYLALGIMGKRIFGQKFTEVKILQTSFKEFWEYLATAFVRKTNVTFGRHKLLNRKINETKSHSSIFGEP